MFLNIYKEITNTGDNIIIKAPDNNNVLISELQLIIKLPSITEMAIYAEDVLLTQEQRDAIFWAAVNQAQNKKVVSYWNNGTDNRLIEFIVFRRSPYYIENLLNRFTSTASFVLTAGTSLKLGIEATNSGLLGSGDSLIAWGQGETI